jgi:hypothetical protein
MLPESKWYNFGDVLPADGQGIFIRLWDNSYYPYSGQWSQSNQSFHNGNNSIIFPLKDLWLWSNSYA